MSTDFSSLMKQVTQITQAAGEAIMAHYRAAVNVSEKWPDNPVTDADLAADTLLRERLLELLPEAGWLSEETVDRPARLLCEYVWVVDPLDGTKEFVQGLPEFAVSVGLVKDGRPVLSVVLNPASGELYQGLTGNSVYLNGTPVGSAQTTDLAAARVEASRTERTRGEFEPFEDHLALTSMGSIAYKLARVAAGQSDATWSRGPKNEWDICAGALLVELAGGRVVDLGGQPIYYNKPVPKTNGIIATNSHLYLAVRDLLGPFGAARSD
jgi:myo-inositol-1(or 4)-monophosphatase